MYPSHVNGLLIAALALSLPLGGCSSSAQAIRRTALERAAFDLSCPAESLDASQLGSTTRLGASQYSYGVERTVMGVSGCGQKAVYVVECGRADVCNAQLNADAKPDPKSAPQE